MRQTRLAAGALPARISMRFPSEMITTPLSNIPRPSLAEARTEALGWRSGARRIDVLQPGFWAVRLVPDPAMTIFMQETRC